MITGSLHDAQHIGDGERHAKKHQKGRPRMGDEHERQHQHGRQTEAQPLGKLLVDNAKRFPRQIPVNDAKQQQKKQGRDRIATC